MEPSDIVGALEAMLFAAGDPLTGLDIKKIFQRLWADEPEEQQKVLQAELKKAVEALKQRWATNGDDPDERGFALTEVADGLVFRTNPRFATALQAMREQRPVRLSRAALETLSIVAYRQPATKPEVDQIRGVDCSATIRLLLDRGMIKILGKREEPGLPLLYGTTKEFLSFFNIANLAQLPSLREYHELTDDSREQLDAFDTEMGLDDLREAAQKLRPDDEPAVQDLDAAVNELKSTEKETRSALAEHGIALEEPKEEPTAAAAAGQTPDAAPVDGPAAPAETPAEAQGTPADAAEAPTEQPETVPATAPAESKTDG